MKSYNHLFEKIIQYDNLELAIKRASKGKKDRNDVKWALEHKDKVIYTIQDMLINDNWKIRYHKPKEIYDGISRKKRVIIQPDFLYEQIIHHAIMQVISPIINNRMYKYSCGSIPKRGGTYAKKYIEKYINKNNNNIVYFVKGDVYHFFPSINHIKLKEKLAKIFHDKKLLHLFDLIIDSYHTEDKKDYGLPIGYYTSQWLANFYLQDFDNYIKQELKCKCYVRYMDDIIFCGNNKENLFNSIYKIQEYLNNILDLKLKYNWSIFLFDNQKQTEKYRKPLDFVGYLFYRNKTILRKNIMIKGIRKAKRISQKDIITGYDAQQMMCWLSWFKRTDTYNCYKENIKPYINVKTLKKKISNKSKAQNKSNKILKT